MAGADGVIVRERVPLGEPPQALSSTMTKRSTGAMAWR
jgi:hypothetical protein